jgi:hypothetical protein
MPFKANAARRHHIPKQKRKVTSWYDVSLRQRGSLTVWFSDEPIAAWQAAPRTTRGGQAWYSPLAILTALSLKAVSGSLRARRKVDRLNYQSSRSLPGGCRPLHVEPTGRDPRDTAATIEPRR